jgi:hypothetical protein
MNIKAAIIGSPKMPPSNCASALVNGWLNLRLSEPLELIKRMEAENLRA